MIDLLASEAEVGVDWVDRSNIRIPFMQISQIWENVLLTPGHLAALGLGWEGHRALNLNVKLLGREREKKEVFVPKERKPTSMEANVEFIFIYSLRKVLGKLIV